MGKVIRIQDKLIGDNQPCFIVAEAGVNHNGSLETAKKIVDTAKQAGADAVKFQIFIPEEIVTIHAAKGAYQKQTTGKEESQYEMLQRLTLTEAEFADLRNYSDKRELIFYATPHDLASVDIFARLALPVIKIASGDLNNGLLLYKLSLHPSLGSKPLFLSTGGSTLDEVISSLTFLKNHGFSGPIMVYHCTSSYPTPTEEQNLNVIKMFKENLEEPFKVLVGFSDNGDQVDVPVDAVIIGAVSVEKHLTLDKSMDGPDHRASLNPGQFAQMVKMIREVEKSGDQTIKNKVALGDGIKKVQPSEKDNVNIFRKAIRARVDMQIGSIITLEKLVPKRVRGSLSPMEFEKLLGKKLSQNVLSDEEITMDKVI